MKTAALTQSQRLELHEEICIGQRALRNCSPTNPWRTLIERKLEENRRAIAD